MQLHTVRAGETLTAIGGEYGVSPGLIARVNGLESPFALAVGQSLLILKPRVLHTVRSGETLYSVARQYDTDPLQLLRNNPNLEGRAALFPGQVLVIDWEDTPDTKLEINGYAEPDVQEAVLRTILPYSTFLAPFTYGVSKTGGLVPLNDETLLRWADQYGVTPWLHLSTLTEDGTFSNERAAVALATAESRASLADAAIGTALEKGYGGIDVDFEFIFPEQAEAYADFVALLRQRANGLGLEVVVALAPKTSADQAGVLYQGHNYRLLGEAANAVLLMTYEWGYTYRLICCVL